MRTPHPASEPNLESGANIDCCKLYRDNKPVRVPTLCYVINQTRLRNRNTNVW